MRSYLECVDSTAARIHVSGGSEAHFREAAQRMQVSAPLYCTSDTEILLWIQTVCDTEFLFHSYPEHVDVDLCAGMILGNSKKF